MSQFFLPVSLLPTTNEVAKNEDKGTLLTWENIKLLPSVISACKLLGQISENVESEDITLITRL